MDGAGGAHMQEVLVWEAESGKLAQRLAGLSQSVRGLAFTADNERLAALDGETLRVWRLPDGDRLLEQRYDFDFAGGQFRAAGDRLVVRRLPAGRPARSAATCPAGMVSLEVAPTPVSPCPGRRATGDSQRGCPDRTKYPRMGIYKIPC
jgi:hypothetical protein